jgi:hypothetical protein
MDGRNPGDVVNGFAWTGNEWLKLSPDARGTAEVLPANSQVGEPTSDADVARLFSAAASAPMGWYTDPDRPGMQRYWDGTSWTEDRVPLVAPAFQPSRGHGSSKYGTRDNVVYWVGVGLACLAALFLTGLFALNAVNQNAHEQELRDAYCQSFGGNDPSCQ